MNIKYYRQKASRQPPGHEGRGNMLPTDRRFSDAEVRYFLAKSAIVLGLKPFDRRLTEGWERFVAWRETVQTAKEAARYAKCLTGLQPRPTITVSLGSASRLTFTEGSNF